MKTTFETIVAVMFLLGCSSSNSSAQELNANLKILEPFVGKTWTGMLTSPDGSEQMKVVRNFIPFSDGSVIKCTKKNEDIDNFGEGYFYWNDIEKKIAFFFIENNGVFLEGFLTVKDNTFIIEGQMTWPTQMDPNVKQQYDFRNEFEFTEDSKMIDRWFMNAFGPWRPGHVIEFSSEKGKEDELTGS